VRKAFLKLFLGILVDVIAELEIYGMIGDFSSFMTWKVFCYFTLSIELIMLLINCN
jgi:hypothetical protein